MFGAALAGIYEDAVLYRRGAATDDGTGSISVGGDTPHPCKAQVDSATQGMRAAKDFVETDMRVLVLTNSCGARPAVEDTIDVISGRWAGTTWRIMSRGLDPAGAAWEMRGRQVSG
jgi:hypothetical protein